MSKIEGYIDVRGPWPIYFVGFKAYKLVGAIRSISVDQARSMLGLDREE